MPVFLNPVSYSIGTLALVVGMLALFINSMLHRRNGWLEPALCVGGFVLSAACMAYGIANGPYRGDTWPLPLFGGVGTALVALGSAALVAWVWQRRPDTNRNQRAGSGK